MFAKHAFASASDDDKREWVRAWASVTGIARLWDPTMHLTKYLAQRQGVNALPRPTEWVRWFVKDEQEERQKAALAVKQADPPKPWYE